MGSTYAKSAEAILLPIFASLAIILLIVPFIWHWRLRNIGACSLFFYISLRNSFTFINAIIWPTEDFDNWWNGAGLCDIEAKLKWPHVTGLACATLCITRNLANVLDIDRAELSLTEASKRRKVVVDLAICFAIPVLQIILHYIIQVNRYYITAIGGCEPSYDNSWPTIVIMFMWPLIFCLITCYYAVVVIYRLRKYRSSFSAILSSSSSNLTTARFLRLFIMCITLLFLYTPVSIYFFYVNLNIQWLPYSWSSIHDLSTWWAIIYLPELGVRTFDAWVSIAMAFFVFVYFGMGGDAVDTYRKWMVKIGLGKCFPSLKHPRRQDLSTESGNWTSQFSLISRAKQYFDGSRKTSNATTLGTSRDQTSSTPRKPSLITLDHTASLHLPPSSPPPPPSKSAAAAISPLRRNATYPSANLTLFSSSAPLARPLASRNFNAHLTTHIYSTTTNDIATTVPYVTDGKVRVNTDVKRDVFVSNNGTRDLETGI